MNYVKGTKMLRLSRDEVGANVVAVFDMLAISEGTAGQGDDGYNVIVGSSSAHPHLFTSYADHPRVRVWIPRINDYSTAAGRYQQIVRTWDGLQQKLHLPDFSPVSQDYACIELLHEADAVADANAGYIERVIRKCAATWASLPGAGYGQHEQRMGFLIDAYKHAGGEYFAS